MMKPAFPPGPKPQPVLGNLLAFRKDPLGFFTACAREYGEVAHYRIGRVNAYLLSRPDLIEQVLVTDSSNFIKGRVVRANRLLLGNGLLASEGEYWRRQRRLSQPAFQRDRLAGYTGTIIYQTAQMLAGWHDGDIHDIHHVMNRLTLQIVAGVLFGAELADEAEEISAAIRAAWEEFTARLRSGLLIPERLPTPGNRRYRRSVQRLDEVVQRMIARRRLSGADTGDFLSLLLAAKDADGSRMTDVQVRDEVMNFFVAGHETTALLLTWAWYLLAQHPAAAGRLGAELDHVLGTRLPRADDIPRLPYVRMLVKEVLRLYPPVWAIPRQVVRDCEIGGYRVPAGSSVTLSQWVMHRDPRYFDHPELFRPERWENDLEKQLPAFAYFPFGAGPRQCIGFSLAMTEAVLIIALVGRAFRFSLLPDHPVKPWPSITLYPRYGIQVKLHARPGQHFG